MANIALYNHALALLRTMLGSQANFRPGQWEAIEIISIKKKRALVVQRTGWGKSLVYFLATKLLREQGAGPMTKSRIVYRYTGDQIGRRNPFWGKPKEKKLFVRFLPDKPGVHQLIRK